MPLILYKSYHIISDAGIGMAMFSLGESNTAAVSAHVVTILF